MVNMIALTLEPISTRPHEPGVEPGFIDIHKAMIKFANRRYWTFRTPPDQSEPHRMSSEPTIAMYTKLYVKGGGHLVYMYTVEGNIEGLIFKQRTTRRSTSHLPVHISQ